ncbi:MAG: phosphodiester glycosidase family protein [Pseudomonadota bacterium]
MAKRLLASLAVVFASQMAHGAPECRSDRFEGVKYTACTIDPARDTIRLYHSTPDGDLIGSFTALSDLVADQGQKLALAMNAGMYHPDRRPVGLYIEDGVETAGIQLRAGPGNFGLLPNGVFCLAGTEAVVMESRRFDGTQRTCDFATQSGPLMVESGALHPRFLPDSTSEFVRNGVGVTEDGNVIFAISDEPVNFHRFARLFRDRLNTPDALYLDGKVSRIYAPDLGRGGIGLPLGPILGVVSPAD